MAGVIRWDPFQELLLIEDDAPTPPRQAVGQPCIESAVAAEETLIEQADVEFGIGIVDLGAFVRCAHGVAHAQAGVPQMLEECRDGVLGGCNVALGREEQKDVDIRVREELPPGG